MVKDNDHQIKILLAVWGEGFINDFLKFSLPSLLAPGNIPAMAKEYSTKFVVLTRASQTHFFDANPIFQKLKSQCEVEFLAIDDLIVIGNYSTTMTLAYDRAIKNTGEQMLNTYFVFLVSDYIMADGSLQGLMRYMKKGYSGICAGNFQVNKEEIKDYLLDQFDPVTQTMPIQPRALLEKSFSSLHPIVFASIIDQKVLRNYYANRFFYRYDVNVMAGRFYLLHMLCIKPETTNYKVGSSCDYSFIPEMCPSGNIGIINDSDDYLVVEIQSKDHELNFINWGQYDLSHLANMLSEWTTLQHRNNAKQTIYFHVRDVSSEDKLIIEETLNTFVDTLSSKLNQCPVKPYYNHPYWIGAITSYNNQRECIKNYKDYDFYGLSLHSYAVTLPKKIYYKVFGVPPKVFPWHFRFREYQAVRNLIEQNAIPEKTDKTLVLYDSYVLEFMQYCAWIKDSLKVTRHYYFKNLMADQAKLSELSQGQFEICFLFVKMEFIGSISFSLKAIRKMLNDNGKVIIIVLNEHNRYARFFYDFRREFGYKLNGVFNSPYRIENVSTIHNNLTMLGAMSIDNINRAFSYSKKRRFLAYILVGSIGALLAFIKNCLPNFSKKNFGHCAAIVATLSPNYSVKRDV